ncbi:MAG: bacteriohemerythrin [Deltaproteobacteria bacterium]|nr:bacteriohemerythrin [Deltaproteobacteria bacterium]
MLFMEWNYLLSVKVESIDRQHEKLVILLNEMYDAICTGKGKAVVGPILDELIDYSKTHFAHEERLMREKSYHYYEAHKLEHDKLTNQVIAFKETFDEGRESVHLKLMHFLKNWLIEHIFGTDMKLGYFLSKQ